MLVVTLEYHTIHSDTRFYPNVSLAKMLWKQRKGQHDMSVCAVCDAKTRHKKRSTIMHTWKNPAMA